ncbi:unnamed protein product [Rotaria socialis]|uniref:Uncharacterized protein n=1 Tax=Rotaria socialis TaxID=392032 RepID=A0A818MA74_9BILA|nr:unnamed protein product [Rotaria socialis]
MVLLRKIKRGRRSIVWKFNGDAQYIDGPRLAVVWPCINRIQPLYMHQANDMQFLEVNYLDGTTEVKPGPVALSDDPLKILSIFTKDLIKLDANELLVLYTQKENETKQDALSVRNIIKDLKLEKRFERSQKERKMELDQMLHKLDMTKQQHASQLQNREADNQMHLQHQQLLHDDEIKFYQRLKELGTDITQIMVAQQRNPDKLIQIMNEKDKRTSPNIQFVDNI